MAGNKQSIQVTIFHQPYTLRVPAGERDVIELADSLDQLMAAVASRSGVSDPLRVAVLASLHLADRLRSLEHELTSLRQRVDAKSEEFGALLEKILTAEAQS